MANRPDAFVQELMAARPLYHQERPTRILIIQGKLTKEQVRIWVKQLHYFRVNVPKKELYILANCPIREVRVELMKKYIEEEDDRVIGGTAGPHSELWLRLGEGLGVAREAMEDFRDLSPEYRLLVDSWVAYARDHSWIAGVALSFDEDAGKGRSGPWFKLAKALVDFYGAPEWAVRHLTLHADLDVEHGSSVHDLVRTYAVTETEQDAVRQAVRFKRAFMQLEDRCIRIAARIDPRLYAGLDGESSTSAAR